MKDQFGVESIACARNRDPTDFSRFNGGDSAGFADFSIFCS